MEEPCMNAETETIKPLLDKVADGNFLSETEAGTAFDIIMSGNATPAQIGAFLMGLRVRGETVNEITAAARIMRSKALSIVAPKNAIDLVGTGGDGSGTLNISTGAAIVVAGCGVPVAKHGNRALSSKTGSADVLSALGVNINCEMSLIEKSIKEAGIGFMMAPRHHSATRHVAGPRVELATRTIFNILGPLSNPASVKRLLVGVFDRKWVKPMAEVLRNLGAEKAWVVHGSDGLDELTITGPTYVAAWENSEIKTFEVSPDQAGLPYGKLEDLKGGSSEENANAMLAMLQGKPSAFRDVVVYTAAAALLIANKTENLKQGSELAKNAIDNGSAKRTLDKLISITNEESGSVS